MDELERCINREKLICLLKKHGVTDDIIKLIESMPSEKPDCDRCKWQKGDGVCYSCICMYDSMFEEKEVSGG